MSFRFFWQSKEPAVSSPMQHDGHIEADTYSQRVIALHQVLAGMHHKLKALQTTSSSHKFTEPAVLVEALKQLVAQKNLTTLAAHHQGIDIALSNLYADMCQFFGGTLPPGDLRDGMEALGMLRAHLCQAVAGVLDHVAPSPSISSSLGT